jgi:DNA modification methylase
VIWLDLSVDHARVLGLALNKISGSWDEQLLARLLGELQEGAEVDLTLSGFGEDEVRDLLRSLEAREKRERPESFDLADALEEARRAPRSKPGDLWRLGEHRLLCGDSTDPVAVLRALDGTEPTLLTTDPPYGVSLDPTWRDGVYNALGPAERPYLRTKGHRNTTVSGDTRVDWADAFALVPSLQVGYVWHAGVHAAAVAEGLVRVGFEIVSQVVWDKGLFAIGRSWYHWGHEPCWVVRRRGSKAKYIGSRDQSTVWRAPSPKMIMAGSDERKEDHPTQKPLVLFETPIRNHLKPGGVVYEPFSGSGTALIAAERTGTICRAIEIDPVFVDVALRRWERFSGLQAELVDE